MTKIVWWTKSSCTYGQSRQPISTQHFIFQRISDEICSSKHDGL